MDKETFVFFDNSTGQILATHVHVSIEGQTEPLRLDELRKTYRSFPGQEVDPDRIEVLQVDVDLLGHGGSKRGFSVDLDSRRIVPRDG
jgi:hypothetical protein